MEKALLTSIHCYFLLWSIVITSSAIHGRWWFLCHSDQVHHDSDEFMSFTVKVKVYKIQWVTESRFDSIERPYNHDMKDCSTQVHTICLLLLFEVVKASPKTVPLAKSTLFEIG